MTWWISGRAVGPRLGAGSPQRLPGGGELRLELGELRAPAPRLRSNNRWSWLARTQAALDRRVAQGDPSTIHAQMAPQMMPSSRTMGVAQRLRMPTVRSEYPTEDSCVEPGQPRPTKPGPQIRTPYLPFELARALASAAVAS